MDKRVEKSKAAIKKALSELIVRKGFLNVKAGEVAKRADVNRSTLYLHYSSLDVVLDEMEDDVVAFTVGVFMAPHPDFRSYISDLAEGIASRHLEMKAILLASYSSFQTKIENGLRPLLEHLPSFGEDYDSEDQDFLIAFLIDGSLGLVNTYFQREKPANVDKLIDSFLRFFKGSSGVSNLAGA